jgi:hypothetical protein
MGDFSDWVLQFKPQPKVWIYYAFECQKYHYELIPLDCPICKTTSCKHLYFLFLKYCDTSEYENVIIIEQDVMSWYYYLSKTDSQFPKAKAVGTP